MHGFVELGTVMVAVCLLQCTRLYVPSRLDDDVIRIATTLHTFALDELVRT